MASNDKLIVAAIDFGTTFSGWAYSFNYEYNVEPTKVFARHWNSQQMVTTKAPTAILINPDGKTLHSFGYDAETNYMDLACENKHKEWYYFHHFKMMLHGKMTLDRNVQLEDETQKTLPAVTVFSLAIRFMRQDLLKMTKDRLATGQIKEDEIMWILTVPAIWDDAAKQFMKEAAIMAGIKESSLKIALEPETASLFCRLLPVDRMAEGGGLSNFKTGSKYMILDAGGGTVDITVHEVMLGGKLREIHKASGGAWGGTKVDEAFKQFIINLVGTEVFSRFKNEKKEDYHELFRDFELKKREISPDSEKEVRIRFPSSLKELLLEENGENMNIVITKTGYVDRVSLSGDKIRVDVSVMKDLFSGAVQNIVSHVKDLMKDSKVQEISSILMVGGFSDSKILQDAIKCNFSSVKVIIPEEAGLVVLMGAVVFGHSPSSIAERVCKYTYGTNVSKPFDPTIHDVLKRREYDDGPRCIDLFSKYVEVGQTVTVNEMTKENSYVPGLENQDKIGFDIYASPEKSPMYVTDKGCVKLGSMDIDILDKTAPVNEREFLLSMCFGGTEIEVTVKEMLTGKIYKVTVNFLG